MPNTPPSPHQSRKKLFLASTSNSKANLLKQLHLQFESIDSGYDEPYLSNLSSLDLATLFAQKKAEQAFEKIIKNLHSEPPPEPPYTLYILGSDQTLSTQDDPAEIEENTPRKPNTPEEAIDQLMRLQGSTHHLITALSLLVATYPNQPLSTNNATPYTLFSDYSRADLTMHPLTRQDAQRYVDIDQPIGCLGAYKIESLGISLFDKVYATDYTTIIGLPLITATHLLRKAGFFETDFPF